MNISTEEFDNNIAFKKNNVVKMKAWCYKNIKCC